MRLSRLSSTALVLALGSTGCSSLLGLDDFTEGEASSGTESSGSTSSTGPGGPGSGGGGTGEATSSSTGTTSGPGGGGVGGDGGGVPGELVVTPDEPKVGILRPLQLSANQDVTWSIEEGGDSGTIDDSGLYFAPEAPGTFHVVATSVDDESVTDTVEVTVVGLGVTVLGGIPGGPGNIDGQARRAHFNNPYGVGLDDNNNSRIYVADRSNHTIRKYDGNTGLVTTLAGKAGEPGAVDGPGADARFDSPADLVVDGSIYVADSENDCIRAVNPANGATTTLAGACGITGTVDGATGAASRFDRIQSMVFSPDQQALYVCQVGGGAAIRRVDRDTGETTTVLSGFGTPGCTLGNDSWRGRIYYTTYLNGVPIVRSFSEPYAPAQDVYVADLPPNANGLGVLTGIGGEDHLYTAVSEYDNVTNTSFNRLFRVDVDDETEFTEYLGGEQGYVDGAIADVRLTYASTLSSFRGNGWIFFNDGDGAVRRLDVFGEEVETVLGPVPNRKPVDGSKSVARIPNPIGLALDGAGTIIETNFGEEDNRIRKIDIESGAISSFSGAGGDFESGGAVDGAADEATFGIAVDVVFIDGDYYVADYFGNAIRRVDGQTGDVETIVGQLNEPGDADGVGAAARFNFSDNDGIGGGIATDGVDLYVCDTSNFKIRKVDLSSGTVTTIAGGTEGSGDGIGTDAQFSSPAGITYSNGHLYVAEFTTHTVRDIDLADNQVRTIAGRAGELGHTDGGLGSSTFASPVRLAADGHGNLYVSEFQGNTIRRIALDTNETTTFIGTSGAQGFNAAPLPTTLNCPTAMVIDENGDLVFADACDGVVAIVKAL